MCKKFLYTLSSHQRVIVEKRGKMPLNLKVWLESNKFFDLPSINFLDSVLNAAGFKCKISTYCVFECLNSLGEVYCASTADTFEEAKSLLFHIMPYKVQSYLKNPKFSPDALSVIKSYQKNVEEITFTRCKIEKSA